MVWRLPFVLACLPLVACAYGDPGHPRMARVDGTAVTPPLLGGGGAAGGGGGGGSGGGGGGTDGNGLPTSSASSSSNCEELARCCGLSRGAYKGCDDYQHGDEQQCLNGLGLYCKFRPNPEDGDGSTCDGSVANDHMVECAMLITYP